MQQIIPGQPFIQSKHDFFNAARLISALCERRVKFRYQNKHKDGRECPKWRIECRNKECSFVAICSEGTVSGETSLVHTCEIEFNDDRFRPTPKYDAALQKRADECHVDVQFGTNKKGRIYNVEAVVEGFWGRNYEPPSPKSCKRKAALSTASSGRRKKSPRHSLVTTEGVLRASESDSSGNGEEDEVELDELLDRLASDFDLSDFDQLTKKVDEDVEFSHLADSALSANNSGRRKRSPRHSPVAIEVVPECLVEDFVASGSDLSDNDGEEYEEEQFNVDQLNPLSIGDGLAEFEDALDLLVDELPGFDNAEDLFPTFCETHVIVESRNVRNPKYELGGIFDNGKFAGIIERLDYDSNELTVRVNQH